MIPDSVLVMGNGESRSSINIQNLLDEEEADD